MMMMYIKEYLFDSIMSDNSIITDPTSYIVQYSEKTKHSCILLGVSLFLIILFFIGPFSVTSGSFSSGFMKLLVIGLLIATSTILFQAVMPVINTRGIIETDLFPELKFNFFITVGFILLIAVLGIVVIRL
jgi:hypothetical protein